MIIINEHMHDTNNSNFYVYCINSTSINLKSLSTCTFV